MDEKLGNMVESVSHYLPAEVRLETAWIEVIQRMDSIYADIVRYQVELEEKNANLEEAHQFIHSVLSSISDVLIVADIHGQIQQVNSALEHLLGRSADELTGQDLYSLFLPGCVAKVRGFAEQVRETAVNDVEVELQTASGEAAPIAINCTARYDHHGRFSGLVISGRPLGELRCAYQDLRETHDCLRATQAQLVQSEKMASLGQLVAGVAHELNNPISFVLGNTHALKRYGERLQQYLKAIHEPVSDSQRQQLREELRIDRLMQDFEPLIEGSMEGAERVGQIVEDLRRFSTPNQQQVQLFDLVRVIHTAVDWVVKARREPTETSLELPEEVLLLGYEGYVHQILVNLIQNAVDAMEDSERQHIGIRLETDVDQVSVQVIDSGPGISEESLLRVFDPFFTTKAVGKGTGLGLYISYNLATEQCAGSLRACNSEQGGAEFTLSLPLKVPV